MNGNDLISRAAAIEEIARRDTTDGTVKVYSGREINAILGDLPAVDAVPVVHARWVDEDFPYKDANPRVTAICSKCGNIAHRMEHGYSILSKYCPNCGAKMDGERRESE